MNLQSIQGQFFFNKWFSFLSLIACVLVISEELANPIFGQFLSPLVVFIFSLYLLVGISWFSSPSVQWNSVGISVRHFGFFPAKQFEWNSIRGFKKKNSNSVILLCRSKASEDKIFTGMLNRSDALELVELLLARGISDVSQK